MVEETKKSVGERRETKNDGVSRVRPVTITPKQGKRNMDPKIPYKKVDQNKICEGTIVAVP